MEIVRRPLVIVANTALRPRMARAERRAKIRNMTVEPPRAARRPVTRSFHGDDVVDNYEWFRNRDSEEVQSHIRAENAYFADRTAHLDGLRDTIYSEISARTKETDVSVPVKKGKHWYWSRTYEGKSYHAYFRAPDTGVRPDPDRTNGREQEIYDANYLAEHEAFFSIGSREISPDGELCALAIDTTGEEEFHLQIFKIDTGEIVDAGVSGIFYGLAFSADSTRIYYLRVDDSWRPYQVWEHVIGRHPAEDQLLYQENDERFTVWAESSRDGKWLVVHSSSTTTREARLFAIDDAGAKPFVVTPRKDGVDYWVEVAGTKLLITHNAHNPGFDVASAPLGPSEVSQWHTVLGAGPTERILGVAAFQGFAVVLLRHDGASALRAIRRKGTRWGEPEVIPAPELSTIDLDANLEWVTRSVRFGTESLLDPASVHEWDARTGAVTTLKVTDVPGFERDQYTQERQWATASDGTQVPMTIAYRTDVVPNGTNPAILEGYGAYESSSDPYFSASRLSILDRGIVFAIAHVRGGGELGRHWYEDGKLLHKKNTFTDFIACADRLVELGLADSGRLGAEGGSAGGLLMGAVANMAPEKFRVINAGVPFVDALTTMLKPELPLTTGEWEEWGNPLESKEVYDYMKSYTPYENVRAVEYPAILATTSMNDVRVSYVEPTKWVQALRDTVTNDPNERPIVQYTEMVAGHGGGSGRYKKWEERARDLAFVFDQLGVS